MRWALIVAFAVLASVAAPLTGTSARAQAPPLIEPLEAPTQNDPSSQANDPPAESAEATEPAESSTEQLSPEQAAQIATWIEELGSREFATRERAASRLMEFGKGALPDLRRAIAESADAETRLRAGQIILQMSEGDLQARVEAFLSGKDVNFAGWNSAQFHLGDSVAIRELFVEILLAHPDCLEALDGTTRDRALALEKLMVRVGDRLRTVGQDPGRADFFAMLLIGSDPALELGALYEGLLLNLSRRQVATTIRRDAQLSGPFEAMLNKWLLRTSLSSREDMLVLGMAWDLPATLPLALQTLDEATQTETIATSLQAISKFGDKSQTEILKRFLQDARQVTDRGFGDDPAQSQIRDWAMLTLAMIHQIPFEEIGMSHVHTHPASGFLPSDIAYKSDPEPARERALKRINQLFQPPANGKGS
jgi:hypothetical protein